MNIVLEREVAENLFDEEIEDVLKKSKFAKNIISHIPGRLLAEFL